MTNKKETLIKTLRGSVDQLNRLEDMMDGLTVMDETDHVDNDFLMEMLTCVNAFMDASNKVISKVSSLLAPDAPMDKKGEQSDEGKKWSVEEILRHCTLARWESTGLYIPVQCRARLLYPQRWEAL